MSKSITLVELDQLKRYMGLTFSIHDGEALPALRRSNKILQKYNLTWAEVLGRSVTAGSTATFQNVDAGVELTIPEQISRAFDEIRGTITDSSFKEFIDSIESQFKDTGYLSPPQRNPLFTAVRNLRERRRRDE